MKSRLVSSLAFAALFLVSLSSPATVYRYISIDAGGMLGLIPARLLQDIEEKTGKPIYELVDGMIGTSTGGIISALMTVPASSKEIPCSAKEVIEFYMTRGAPIFEAATTSTISNKLAPMFGKKVDFSVAAGVLKSHTEAVFGQRKISEAVTDLLILSHDKTNVQNWLFDSAKAQQDAQHDVSVSDAVRASGSVADAFGPITVTVASTPRLFVDAGSMGAKPHVIDPTFYLVEKISSQLAEGDEAVIFSIGTGFSRGAVINLQGKKITLVRIEPDVSHLGRGMLAMNLLAANTAPETLQKMIDVAEGLIKNSKEYKRMLADLKGDSKRDEL